MLQARALKVFSFPVFLGAVLVGGIFLNLSVRLIHDAALPSGHWHVAFVEGDTFWHIAVGERILDTHRWLTTNYYSFTAPDEKWMAFQWLGDVLMAGSARLGGVRGLMALLTLLVAAIVVLLYCLSSLAANNPLSAFLSTALVLPLLGSCFTLRPQLLGYVFLVVTLICLERFRQGKQKSLWVLPAVFALWANTHGTFTLGLIVFAIYGAAGLKDFRLGPLLGKAWTPHERRHMATVFPLCVAALLLNPYGPRLIQYELGITVQPLIVSYTEEWMPLSFHEFLGLWFLFLLLAFALGLLILRLPLRVESVALVCLAAYMAHGHQRLAIFFSIVLAPALASELAALLPAPEAGKSRPALNGALIGLFALGAAAFFPSSARLQALIDRNHPRRAVDYIRSHPVAEPMFNDAFWGGYLIWASQGGEKVFIDGRSEAYASSGVLADYLRIIQPAPDALPLLAKYGVRSCLVERAGELSALLGAQPAWHRVYDDDLSVLFERTNSASPMTR